jgi:hemerythrin-like domain-containing protein
MLGELSRRGFMYAGLACLGGLLAGAAFGTQGPVPEQRAEEEVTPNEDLMREHGVLRRLLLVYEEISRRAAAGGLPLAQLAAASGLIRRFIEEYHEKLEEDYVFPVFEKAGRLADLTAVLRAQHEAGRAITGQLQEVAAHGVADTPASQRVSLSIAQFLRMYRPHAAREDTVLFPQFARVAGQEKYRELGEVFEDKEHELFGQAGFEDIVAEVESIEKDLGIYELAQFEPKQ